MPQLPDALEHGPAETKAVFRKVAASRGFVSNLLRSLGHAPEGLNRFMSLGHYARYGTELTEMQRELVVCIIGRNIAYAWAHHAPMAIQAGLSEAQMAELKSGRTPSGLAEPERALCDFAFGFSALKGVPPDAWSALKRHFTPRQCTDVALLAAYFLAAGSLIIGMELEIEPPEVLAQEVAWQSKPRDASGQVQSAPNQAI
jgi:4-carboxymuconolactone decarboxylase